MKNGRQHLFWVVATLIKYLGFTIVEWVVLALGILPGLFLFNISFAEQLLDMDRTGIDTKCWISTLNWDKNQVWWTIHYPELKLSEK